MNRRPTRALVIPATALSVVLALSACGGDSAEAGGMSGMDQSSSSSSSSSASGSEAAAGQFNDADVSFAQDMSVHHAGAIQMSEVLLAKDGVDEQVVALAERIKAAQTPEIEQMTTWLEAWGEPVPDTSGSMEGMEGMDHDMGSAGGSMAGMSEEDMAALEDAPGPEASRLFLEQMTAHHTGAIEMARSQVEQGSDPDAIALAETIISDQEAEIEEMQSLLATL